MQSLSHWTPREVPLSVDFDGQQLVKKSPCLAVLIHTTCTLAQAPSASLAFLVLAMLTNDDLPVTTPGEGHTSEARSQRLQRKDKIQRSPPGKKIWEDRSKSGCWGHSPSGPAGAQRTPRAQELRKAPVSRRKCRSWTNCHPRKALGASTWQL